MALDEPIQNDKLYEYEDITVILNEDLSDKIEVINIYHKSVLSTDTFRVSTDLIWKDEYYGLPWAKPW